MMGNRSDRRLANLSNRRALEAVGPIRISRADFHQGPERHNQLHTEAGYTTATGTPHQLGKWPCARGWVHIRRFESILLRQAYMDPPCQGLNC